MSAIAYDGTKGIMPVASTPMIHFKRQPRRGYDFLRAHGDDDGLLIATFPDIPPALGWAITLTLTDTGAQAAKVIKATMEAAAAVAAVVPGGAVVAGAAKAGAALAGALETILGARVVGTYIGSESDSADLGVDWRRSHHDYKTAFEIEYDVHDDEP